MIRVELQGLQVYGYHGVLESERRDGQPFLFDVEFEVGEAALSDRIADTVDYRAVAELVKRVSDERPMQLLESLAVRVADALAAAFDVEAVRVRVRKPNVQIEGFALDWSAVTVDRRR